MKPTLLDAPTFPENGNNQAVGTWGETLAGKHLESCGYTILDRNWRTKYGELDLVTFHEQSCAVVAVEVKTRRSGGQVPAIHAISRAKLTKLRSMTGQWVAAHDVRAENLRVDLVAITVVGEADWNLEHIEAIA